MSDAIYVSFVPKAHRAKLREVLRSEDTAPVVWRERRGLFGSEFYFSGPAKLTRKAHETVTLWLARQ